MGKNKQTRKEENRKQQTESNFKLISEHEKKLEIIQDQLTKISLKISTLSRTQRVSNLSASQLCEIPQDGSSKFYIQFGKSFLTKRRDTILDSLKSTNASAQEDLPRLTKAYAQFEGMKKEEQNSIKELYDSIKVGA